MMMMMIKVQGLGFRVPGVGNDEVDDDDDDDDNDGDREGDVMTAIITVRAHSAIVMVMMVALTVT